MLLAVTPFFCLQYLIRFGYMQILKTPISWRFILLPLIGLYLTIVIWPSHLMLINSVHTGLGTNPLIFILFALWNRFYEYIQSSPLHLLNLTCKMGPLSAWYSRYPQILGKKHGVKRVLDNAEGTLSTLFYFIVTTAEAQWEVTCLAKIIWLGRINGRRVGFKTF